MQLASFSFLFGFFPLCWLIWRLLPGKLGNPFLLIASFFFYAWGSLSSLALLILILVWSWSSCWMMEQESDPKKKKFLLITSLSVCLVILAAYKYLVPMLSVLFSMVPAGIEIIVPSLPLGLSFYLFSTMGAIIRIYQQKSRLCSPVEFALFVSFFGWITMGPIAHYETIVPQMKDRSVNLADLRQGALLFLQGLCFKVIFADNLALVNDSLLLDASWLGSVLASISYFLQLYFDFAGYSRMARGVAAFFGFTVPKNFDHPYRAVSIQDYWRRWHISLTSWFREFVYIPLGGNRVSENRWMFNVMVVWLLTGIWHGSSLTFMVWGLLQGIFIIVERRVIGKRLEEIPTFIRRVAVILLEIVSDIFFLSATLPAAVGLLGRFFGIGVQGIASPEALFVFRQSFILLLGAVLVCSTVPEWISRWVASRTSRYYPMVCAAGYGLMLVICLSFLVSQSIQTFLYAVF